MVKNLSDVVANNRIPRFRVVDLLVITATIAVGFAVQQTRANLGLSNLMRTEIQWFNLASQSLLAAATGLPLAAIYFMRIEQRYCKLDLIEPGHWIILSLLPGSLNAVSSVTVVPANMQLYLLHAFVTAVSAGILVFAAKMNSGIWRSTFLLIALVNFLDSCFLICCFLDNTQLIVLYFRFATWVETFLNLAIFGSLLILTFIELKKKIERSLWHWIGVLIEFLLVTALPVLNFLYSFLGLWYTE